MSNTRFGQSRTPTQVEVLERLKAYISEGISVCLPATVVIYNPALQVVEVQPLLNKAVIGQDGTETQEIVPTIPNVPVAFPRGGGYFLTLPLQPGDNVLLVFADRSIDTFMTSNGSTPLDQVDLRQHDLSDAIAIPGFFPSTKTINAVTLPDMVLGQEAGTQLRMRGGTAEFTTAGAVAALTGFVAMALKVDQQLQDIRDLLQGNGVPPFQWTPVANDGGAALQTAATSRWTVTPASTASTNLKAD